jgi:hypothetical protein
MVELGQERMVDWVYVFKKNIQLIEDELKYVGVGMYN